MLKAIQLPPSNYLITYYQTLDEVTWVQVKEKINKLQMFWKTFNEIQFLLKNF